MPDIANRHIKVIRTVVHGTLRPCPVQYCRPRTAPVRAANRLLKVLPGGGGRGKACPASPAPMAGGGLSPVDVDPAIPRGPGRRAHLHGSGQLARIQTPSGVSPRPATPRSGRRSLYSAVPRGIQVFWGYIPPHLRRSTGVLVTIHLAGPPPACAPRLNLADAVVRLEGFPWRHGIAQGAFRALGSGAERAP